MPAMGPRHPGPPGMIDQGDIDALVAQLGDATHVEQPDSDAQETLVENSIDDLLDQAEANLTAADAVAPPW